MTPGSKTRSLLITDRLRKDHRGGGGALLSKSKSSELRVSSGQTSLCLSSCLSPPPHYDHEGCFRVGRHRAADDRQACSLSQVTCHAPAAISPAAEQVCPHSQKTHFLLSAGPQTHSRSKDRGLGPLLAGGKHILCRVDRCVLKEEEMWVLNFPGQLKFSKFWPLGVCLFRT